MHIGIVSDTHDNLRLARAAAEFFEDRADIVVHCGDVVAPFTAMVFDSEYEFYAVRGNNEGERALEQLTSSHP